MTGYKSGVPHPLFRALWMAVALLLATLGTARAETERRLALVIGNSAYSDVPGLDNPVRDARLIATALEKAAFEVRLVSDGDQATLNVAIARFGRDLRAAGADATGLFYYAGHGVQSFGTNYLLPVDAALTDAADLPLVGINAEAVLRQMNSARNATNIVILDACRDNPFEQIASMNDNGLAEMSAPTGTFLAYSTAPGAVALDGLGANSPFTAALAEYIPEPGQQIEQLFKAVRIDVLRATNGRQVPWDTSSLTRDFTFVQKVVDPAEREAEALWQSVKDTGDPVQILLFLRVHPSSARAPEARKTLSALIAREAGGVDTAALSEPSRAAPAPAVTATPDPAPAAVAAPPAAPVVPKASERELIEVARASGLKEDYQAYLDAYPEGVYSELAAFEIAILLEKAATAAEPVTEAEPETPQAAPTPAPVLQDVTFAGPLVSDDPAIDGKSIEQLLRGSPLFPPIEGLPEAAWKGKQCSDCHNWQPDNLCVQASTYLAEGAEKALAKKHPMGGGLKANLRRWAERDCPP